MNNSIIKIYNLHRNFIMGDEIVRALNGVSLEINPGDFVTIMGASGSGKSTLLNILGCLDKATEGDYFLDGIDISRLSKKDLAGIRNKKIGFIFQSYNLLARTTALENVELPLLYNPSVSAAERRERAKVALKRVGLESRMKHVPSQLSGGQQQRVAIARSLINNPVIILADEATGNLDTRTSYSVMEIFQELNDNGITIGFVTHEKDIARFSRRTVVLKDGKIIEDDNVENRSLAKEALASLPEID